MFYNLILRKNIKNVIQFQCFGGYPDLSIHYGFYEANDYCSIEHKRHVKKN